MTGERRYGYGDQLDETARLQEQLALLAMTFPDPVPPEDHRNVRSDSEFKPAENDQGGDNE